MKNNNYAFTQSIVSKSTERKNAAAAKIDATIKSVCNRFYLQPERCAAFETLVALLRSRTSLLHPTSGKGDPGWVAPVFLLNRLRNLAERRSQWLRPSCDCRPAGQSLRLEFRSLESHLLGLYPVPGFMDSVWDLPAGPEAFRQQAWFIRLARGASFRELNLPLVLTRKMEHFIRQ